MDRITGTLSAVRRIGGSLSAQAAVTAALSVPETIEPVHYAGPFEFTPSAQAQEIEISGMMATRNITVNPIPSNYGLITWNGSALTVS